MSRRKPTQPPQAQAARVQYRSGAVARVLHMPVATLRVWERRYGLTQSALSPGGQRLYSPEDVRRLALVKRLTEQGHAIGSVASLNMTQLQRVAAAHERPRLATRREVPVAEAGASPSSTWRLALIGPALATRLRRRALLRRLGRPLQLLGPYDDVAQAAADLRGKAVDAVLFHQAQLHEGWLAAVEAAAPDLAGLPKAVLYGYAAEAVCEGLADAGTALLREPQPDAVLGQWLRGVALADAPPRPALGAAEQAADAVPPARWDDAALVDFADRSVAIACECPRHVAELLMQLTHFEAYSAACEHRSPADAELHACLRRTAAAARARFEAALEQVALYEGLPLPAPRVPDAG